MHPDLLFLRRCEQAALLIDSWGDEVALLDLARIIRQLLFDKKCFANTVNTNRIKLEFIVGKYEAPKPPTYFMAGPYLVRQGRPLPTVHVILDSVDAVGFGLPEEEWVRLPKDELGSYAVGHLGGEAVTIKMIIKYAANREGGVHLDPNPTHEDLRVLEGFRADLPARPEQHSMFSYMVRPIGQLVLRSLEPLIEDVRKRHPHL